MYVCTPAAKQQAAAAAAALQMIARTAFDDRLHVTIRLSRLQRQAMSVVTATFSRSYTVLNHAVVSVT